MANLDQIIHAKAIELGKLAVRATTAAGAGHPTTALSLAHLTTVLLYRAMRWTPAEPHDPAADRLVLSEGHAVPIVYAAAADLGVRILPDGKKRAMTEGDLMTLRDIHSPIDGHPNPELGFPFFDAATGSLGQGLSIAAGLAAAARLDRIPKSVYCIVGDGESREGQIWEAMDFIADHRLGRVVAIFNCNTLGQSDFVSSAQDWATLKRKAEAFGWIVSVIDGHNPAEIEAVLRDCAGAPAWGSPHCVIARTVKGWGIPDLGGMGHHGTPVPAGQMQAALDALDRRAAELGADMVTAEDFADAFRIEPPGFDPVKPAPAKKLRSFAEALGTEPKLQEQVAAKKTLSPRRAFGLALKALGDADPRVVALDADVKNSTYALDFATAHPDRYFEARIAEQNMVSVAAGLARGGKIAFASTFGKFLVRALDQIEMAIIGGAAIKLVGTHIGVTLASDGPSQMAVADVAFMRAIAHVRDYHGRPAATVLTPSDPVSAYQLVLAMAAAPGAVYLRAVRGDLDILYGEDEEFPLRGHKVVRHAQARPGLVLAATGYMVHSCLKAARQLASQGIDAIVVDAYSLPLDAGAVLALAEGAPVVTVEDNYVGGLGSELAEASSAAGGPRVYALTVGNLPKSGRKAEDVLSYVHLGVDDIVAAAREIKG